MLPVRPLPRHPGFVLDRSVVLQEEIELLRGDTMCISRIPLPSVLSQEAAFRDFGRPGRCNRQFVSTASIPKALAQSS